MARLRFRSHPFPSRLEERLQRLWAEAGGQPLEREFRFHLERRWRSDFAHLSSRRLTEIEGGIWTLGRHSTGAWRAPVQTAEGSSKGGGAVGRRPNQPGR